MEEMSAAPAEFLKYVDVHKDAFIKRLANAIAIPRSVSNLFHLIASI